MRLSKVFKYTLDVRDVCDVWMPRGAKIIHLDAQSGVPCLWAEVNVTEPQIEKRTFHTYGTGRQYDADGLNYIGSYLLMADQFVGHVFEYAIRPETT